jgi:hypothetical protein
MFGRKPKWGVLVPIFDERAGGGMEFSMDLGRRAVDPDAPGKTYYLIKKRKVRTKPSEYYRLIPGPGGKKILPLYGISHDELFPLRFSNLTTEEVQATNNLGQNLYFQTKPVPVKDDEGNILYFKVDSEGKPTEETTTESTNFPIEQEEVVSDEKGEPVVTTEKTPYAATIKRPVKLVEPTPTDLRFWLARTQEEDKIKYDRKSFWDKYGQYVTMATLGAIILIAILFTMHGIENIVATIETINQGFNANAAALQEIASQLEVMNDVQTIKPALTP